MKIEYTVRRLRMQEVPEIHYRRRGVSPPGMGYTGNTKSLVLLVDDQMSGW